MNIRVLRAQPPPGSVKDRFILDPTNLDDIEFATLKTQMQILPYISPVGKWYMIVEGALAELACRLDQALIPESEYSSTEEVDRFVDFYETRDGLGWMGFRY